MMMGNEDQVKEPVVEANSTEPSRVERPRKKLSIQGLEKEKMKLNTL